MTFKPEFLNRIDDIVIFQPLTEKQIAAIVEIQLERVRSRLAQRSISLKITKKASEFIATRGFDPAFGARPLKRVIQEMILDELSLQIVEGKVKDGDTVTADAVKGTIVLKTA